MVIKAKDVPHWKESLKDQKALAKRKKHNKKFEQLNEQEKEGLLKTLAMRAGLVIPSED
jgi:hypothetical protein